MIKYIYIRKEHERLTELYTESGLEISENWVSKLGPILSVLMYENSTFIGGASVSYRYWTYILDYIAIKEYYRGRGYGRNLFESLLDHLKDRNINHLYMAAKEPLFFKWLGAVEANDYRLRYLLYECRDCPQFNESCKPEVLVMDTHYYEAFYTVY